MSDVIKLLPDSVANQIAAGEVIQRPASVIKELVENAIDAHATSVQIVLKDAGRTLIQVIDNGQGMSATDARLAFERHSTSKIRDAQDLFALSTMGFRGEALASIAAISHVELRTCARGEQVGTKLLINASQCESQEPYVCPQGSNFMIKDLFFNVPARRKFLKGNNVELNNIVKEFEKLALINYGTDFTLTHNGNVMYQLTGGSFKQRIVALFGKHLDQQLIPLSIDTSLVKITGFIGKPENARKSVRLQYFFVNGRFMRHPYFHKAVLTSYSELIPDDAQPNYFLIFKVSPESIDVNIHPAKTEIKFENEQPIWQIIAASVRETLGKFSVVPSIDFDTENAPVIPVAPGDPGAVKVPEISVDPSYNPFAVPQQGRGGASASSSAPAAHTSRGSYNSSQPLPGWEELYRGFENAGRTPAQPPAEPDGPATHGTLNLKTPSDEVAARQIYDRYLLLVTGEGLLLLDQHRAHLQVLYERLMRHVDGTNIVSQRVLFPEVMHLTPAQDALMTELEPELERAGFGLSHLSGGDWSIIATPQELDGVDVKELLLEVLTSTEAGGAQLKKRIYEHIALTVASKAAIKRGRILNDDEVAALAKDWKNLKNNRYTPHGKPIMTLITTDQLAKLF